MTEAAVQETSVQLDRGTRSELERAVLEMRSAAEADLRYQLTDRFGLDTPGQVPTGLSEDEKEQREALREAIEREAVDGHDWEEALDLYVEGLGYTVVNRLAALRCMEARGFLDRSVTRFREDGRTPAADPLIDDEFYTPEEAPLEAYRRACDRLAEDVELLFDPDSVYSRLQPRPSAFEDLCRTLDEVPEEAWRADDVLGWVYQYYHIEDLDDLRRKADREGLDPEDVAPANQFYTPHWVVRMLTDNSLGKLYLEHAGRLEEAEEAQEGLTPEGRKGRSLDPGETPTVADLCTYLVPGSEAGESTDWSDPSELRVIDPACGSGHFLLYAFDVLERIWWAERPDVPRSEVPARILEHNLYGVDLDLRACQLAAFNLYLKARRRSEAEGARDFELPPLNIVCADARAAEFEEAHEVIQDLTGEGSRERQALDRVLTAFKGSHGLGSLLDVKGTLEEELLNEQRSAFAAWDDPDELMEDLIEAVEERRKGRSFLLRDLRSFLRLLEILSATYDVALMNPPYGSQKRLPSSVKSYIRDHYTYRPEYYINFVEVCNSLLYEHGRIGMLVPRSFMYKRSHREFREDFVGPIGTFEFLAEFGLEVLDHATVRTVGTILRRESEDTEGEVTGRFIRLHDLPVDQKEGAYLNVLGGSKTDTDGIRRYYERASEDFSSVPGAPLNYWVPDDLREIYGSDVVFDADNAGVNRKSVGLVKTGLSTGNNARFHRYFWECMGDYEKWVPVAKGGEDAFILPEIDRCVHWIDEGAEIKRIAASRPQNIQHYFREGVTWTFIKDDVRRFGYLNKNSIFGHAGKVFLPDTESVWSVLGYTSSTLFGYLMIGLTLYRGWEVGKVAQAPWDESIAEAKIVEGYAQQLVKLKREERRYDITSPYYVGPALLDILGVWSETFQEEHPHRDSERNSGVASTGGEREAIGERSDSLGDLARLADRESEEVISEAAEALEKVDQFVWEAFDISEELQEECKREIELRSNEELHDVRGRMRRQESKNGAGVSERVTELLHYFAVEEVRENGGGVVPISSSSSSEEPGLNVRIRDRFVEVWGEFSDDRLREADQALGAGGRTGTAFYPNLRDWLRDELFVHHASTFENTPFIWRLTTERLVPDAKGEGFGCVIDYHQLSASTFDALGRRYLEPRKSSLRERRDAADERRHDQSLPASERNQAEEEHRRCQSGLQQVEALEDSLRDLARPSPRDWSEEDQKLADDLKPKVARFRKRLEERLQTLDGLWEAATDDWLEDTFSPTFRNRVQDNREEWLDALEDLESACEAYALPADEPVEAHLYDLFVYYYDDLIGSTHYGSNGIYFLNYYFSKGEKYLSEDGTPRSGLAERERLLAELARETDADIELGEEIREGCEELADRIPSDWEERALSEVTTAGYRPVHKHGVRINITPLAEADLVPELVERKVL